MAKKDLLKRAVALFEQGEISSSEMREIISYFLSQRDSKILRLYRDKALSFGEVKEMMGLAA